MGTQTNHIVTALCDETLNPLHYRHVRPRFAVINDYITVER